MTDAIGDLQLLAARPTVTAQVALIAADGQASELAAYFGRNGVHCRTVADPHTAPGLLSSGAVDAAIVDGTAADCQGLEIVELLRRGSALPVIVLTAPGRADVRILSLERGADDALSKPISARELLARLRAILRRRHRQLRGRWLTVGSVELDLISKSACVDFKDVELTRVEFDLLAALAHRAGRVIPRSSLLNLAGRTPGAASERAIDVHVSRLRKKVSLGAGGRNLIASVRGVGYVLTAGDDTARNAPRDALSRLPSPCA